MLGMFIIFIPCLISGTEHNNELQNWLHTKFAKLCGKTQNYSCYVMKLQGLVLWMRFTKVRLYKHRWFENQNLFSTVMHQECTSILTRNFSLFIGIMPSRIWCCTKQCSIWDMLMFLSFHSNIKRCPVCPYYVHPQQIQSDCHSKMSLAKTRVTCVMLRWVRISLYLLFWELNCDWCMWKWPCDGMRVIMAQVEKAWYDNDVPCPKSRFP